MGGSFIMGEQEKGGPFPLGPLRKKVPTRPLSEHPILIFTCRSDGRMRRSLNVYEDKKN